MKTLQHNFKKDGEIDLAAIRGYLAALIDIQLNIWEEISVNYLARKLDDNGEVMINAEKLVKMLTKTRQELASIISIEHERIIAQVNEITAINYEDAILQSIPNTETS